jgi:hypothetical protein
MQHPRRGKPAPTRRLRVVRRRALLLALVWVSSGSWAVGHALDHKLHGAEGSALPAPGVAISLLASQGHGHTHPRILPVVPGGKSPELQTPPPLPVSLDPACVAQAHPRPAPPDAAGARAVAVTVHGPRAPPVS